MSQFVQYLQFWPYILGISLSSSLVGGFAYAVARFFERQWKWFPWVTGISLLLGILALFLFASARITDMVLVGATLVSLVLGGWFHRRSGGVSEDWCAATLLMFVVLVGVNLIFWSSGTGIFNLTLSPFISLKPGSGFWIFCFEKGGDALITYSRWVYPILAPLAVWIWQSLKGKPGIEVDLPQTTAT